MKLFFQKLLLKAKKNIPYTVSFCVMVLSGLALIVYFSLYFAEMQQVRKSVEELKSKKEEVLKNSELTPVPAIVTFTPAPAVQVTEQPENNEEVKVTEGPTATPAPTNTPTNTPTPTPFAITLTPEGAALLAQNPDYVGWVSIKDTEVDYPVVMERQDDKDYYMSHWFDGSKNKNGTLFIQPSCETGVGYAFNDYYLGSKPTTNIIIFGHNQYSQQMFGSLRKYRNQDYYEEHKYIEFDTVYEHRVYEVISVFRSHVFNQDEEAFRYYYFYNADTEEQFDYWLRNITKKNEIKTTATAKYGDEFITLSTCSDSNEYGKLVDNGRLAVIGVRIQ